jgi:hypothetical protein
LQLLRWICKHLRNHAGQSIFATSADSVVHRSQVFLHVGVIVEPLQLRLMLAVGVLAPRIRRMTIAAISGASVGRSPDLLLGLGVSDAGRRTGSVELLDHLAALLASDTYFASMTNRGAGPAFLR